MRVPVLTYHSMNIHGNEYANNDHVALASDLACLHALGLRIVPLSQVVDALDDPALDPGRAVALSFDDGPWFDWYDLDHPYCGPQRSFAHLLREHRDRTGVEVHATSFVIASPDARRILDVTCMVGRGWWSDEWWPEAVREGLIAIESHSWDHNHDTLPVTVQHAQRKGTFLSIESYADADAEVRVAADYIDSRCAPHRASLFAYPYGEVSDYLADEYFPMHRQSHRVRAAFATAPTPITRDSNRWRLPRYVCGLDWKSTQEFQRLLEDSGA